MRLKFFVLAVVVFLSLAGNIVASAAGPQDAFVAAKKFETRYFTIQLQSGIDEAALVQSLDIGPEHMMFSGQGSFSPHDLGDVLDALFSWAGGYLDMQLYSYRGKIKIVRDERGLEDVYRSLYGVEHTGEKGFYVYEGNTLYLVADDFTKEIVGHEIAHAIISNFFVVQPPAKVQEVLAGYIEYQLRKKSPAVSSPSR